MSYLNAKCPEFICEVGQSLGVKFNKTSHKRDVMMGVDFNQLGNPLFDTSKVKSDKLEKHWVSYMTEVTKEIVRINDEFLIKHKAWSSQTTDLQLLIPEPQPYMDQDMVDYAVKMFLR